MSFLFLVFVYIFKSQLILPTIVYIQTVSEIVVLVKTLLQF